MTTQEITQIYLHSTGLSWDKYPANNASLDNIDLEKVETYIEKAKKTGRKKIRENEKPLQVLEKMNLVINGQPTWAAVLLFSKDEYNLIIWSPGNLPFGITLDELFEPHSSTLRNKGLAEVFYDLELIEQWGSGIEKMQQYCMNAGLPDPVFEEHQGFQVVFLKDIYNEDYLRSLNLNERQIKAVMHVKKNENITNTEYQEICNTSERTSSRDLAELVSSGLFEQIGITGKGTAYILRRQRRHNDAI